MKGNIIRWLLLTTLLSLCSVKFLLTFYPFLKNYCQQNTAYELNALSMQWKELCQKNIDISAACASVENRINELKRGAAERWLLRIVWFSRLISSSFGVVSLFFFFQRLELGSCNRKWPIGKFRIMRFVCSHLVLYP